MRTPAAIQTVIDDLDYDFASFAIDDFQRHIERRRGQPLQVRYAPFLYELFGFWCNAERADYVFINAKLHPAQRIHTLLHEFAHILLGHRGMNLSELLGEDLARELGFASYDGHLRAAERIGKENSPEDQEAELFVLLIQRKLLAARRLHELYGEPTSIAFLRPYVEGLDFNG